MASKTSPTFPRSCRICSPAPRAAVISTSRCSSAAAALQRGWPQARCSGMAWRRRHRGRVEPKVELAARLPRPEGPADNVPRANTTAYSHWPPRCTRRRPVGAWAARAEWSAAATEPPRVQDGRRCRRRRGRRRVVGAAGGGGGGGGGRRDAEPEARFRQSGVAAARAPAASTPAQVSSTCTSRLMVRGRRGYDFLEYRRRRFRDGRSHWAIFNSGSPCEHTEARSNKPSASCLASSSTRGRCQSPASNRARAPGCRRRPRRPPRGCVHLLGPTSPG